MRPTGEAPADFSSIRTSNPGDGRPGLPDVGFPIPAVRSVPIASLRQWILDHQQAAASCASFAQQWRDDPTISDGQWLANLYDLGRSQHLMQVYADEIDRRRARNRESNRARPPRTR